MKKTIEFECGDSCTLHKFCKSPRMKMSGDKDAEVLFVGEAPGETEDVGGEPFIGDAGNLLRSAIQQIGLSSFAMTNAIRCRPPYNRNPSLDEIKTCKPFLIEDIQSMKNLKLIVLLGNFALQSITGIRGGITKQSGKLLKIDGYNVLPILHPAYVLRNQNELVNFFNHMGRIPNAIKGSLMSLEDRGTYTIIKELQQFKDLCHKIIQVGEFAFDIETNGLSPFLPDSKIKCIGFSCKNREAFILPMPGSMEFPFIQEDWIVLLEYLKIIFESRKIHKIAQNAKFDILWLRKIYGIDITALWWDTKIAEFLLNENESNHLKDMAWKYSRCGGYEKELSGEPQNIDGIQLFEYCAKDCDLTFRIYEKQKPQILADPGLSFLLLNLLNPVSIVLSRIEEYGLRIDEETVRQCNERVNKILEQLLVEIKKQKSVIDWEKDNDEELNPRSHTHLREVLFKYEGLPSIKETPKSKLPSTDQEVLKILSERNTLCKMFSDFSTYSTIKSKTLTELTERVINGEIHTTFWLTEAATGRTSSSKPSMQNIPKGDKDVIGIRKAFIPKPGCVLVEFDYNQHELRVIAEIAGDEVLKEALKSDVHKATAASIKGIPPDQVTDEDRRTIGKTFNFGIIYGMSVHGIMQRLKCAKGVAEAYLQKFLSTYTSVAQYQKNIEKQVRTVGYVKSMIGRYRRFPAWSGLKDEEIREAINMPVQSLAADILLYSIIGIDHFCSENNLKSYMALETHDSVLLNIYKEELWIIPKIKHIMLTYFKNFMTFNMPLDVSVKIGSNLGEMESIQ